MDTRRGGTLTLHIQDPGLYGSLDSPWFPSQGKPWVPQRPLPWNPWVTWAPKSCLVTLRIPWTMVFRWKVFCLVASFVVPSFVYAQERVSRVPTSAGTALDRAGLSGSSIQFIPATILGIRIVLVSDRFVVIECCCFSRIMIIVVVLESLSQRLVELKPLLFIKCCIQLFHVS